MDQISITLEAVNKAETLVNNFYKEYSAESDESEYKEFCSFKLQAAIIQFELGSQLLAYLRSEPLSFSRKITLKDLIHILYEYDKTLRGSHVKRMIQLANTRGLSGVEEKFREASGRWRSGLQELQKFTGLRNRTTAHYHEDIATQVAEIASVNEDKALEVIRIFLMYNQEVLLALRNIGANQNL